LRLITLKTANAMPASSIAPPIPPTTPPIIFLLFDERPEDPLPPELPMTPGVVTAVVLPTVEDTVEENVSCDVVVWPDESVVTTICVETTVELATIGAVVVDLLVSVEDLGGVVVVAVSKVDGVVVVGGGVVVVCCVVVDVDVV
jgi:hypothetical protein